MLGHDIRGDALMGAPQHRMAFTSVGPIPPAYKKWACHMGRGVIAYRHKTLSLMRSLGQPVALDDCSVSVDLEGVKVWSRIRSHHQETCPGTA
ncbi:unnamed protein product [Boreogadus saida]